MAGMRRDHFKRATADIGAHGDNDTLPFDVDNRFVKEKQDELIELAFAFSSELAKGNSRNAEHFIESTVIFAERLLAPTGPSGFRIVTKLHPLGSIYFNGLGVAIAEALEPTRSERASSYRFKNKGDELLFKDGDHHPRPTAGRLLRGKERRAACGAHNETATRGNLGWRFRYTAFSCAGAQRGLYTAISLGFERRLVA